MLKIFVILFTVILLSSPFTSAELDEFIQTTGYRCANEIAELKCDSNKMIIITAVISRRSELNDCTLIDDKYTDFSEYEYDYKDKCNGRESCMIQIKPWKHIYGLFKSTSDFTSNRVNVYYTCIPKSNNGVSNSVKSFTMCSTDVITDVNEGFIQSPGYPSYYGNNRNCKIDVKLPSNEHKLIAYLITLNVESKGWLSRVPKDYLYIENTFKSLYGKEGPQMLLFENKQATFRFRTDFVTTSVLSAPKGFLIYFKILKMSPPTTIKTTTTTTTLNQPIVFQPVEQEEPVSIEEAIADKMDNDLGLSQSLVASNKETRTESSRPDRSTLFACIIVGLCGLVVILVATILLLIRRRQSQDAPSDDYSATSSSSAANYSVVERIRNFYSNKKEKPSILTISAPKQPESKLNETMDGAKDNKKENADLNKSENIYVSSPIDLEEEGEAIVIVKGLKSAPSDEVIYETINEIESGGKVKQQQQEQEDNNKLDDPNIYSTPSNNKEISPDEKRIFIQQQMNNSEILDMSVNNTSSTHLLS